MTSPLHSKRVLVTGSGGFLGRHVVRKLEEAGAEVVPFRGNMLLEPLVMEPQTASLITDAHLIIHLAGLVAGAVPNRTQPWRFLRGNTLMALNAIDLALWLDVPLVAAGSVCAYPEDAPIPFQEKDFWMGSPDRNNYGYGIAKRLLGGALECAYLQAGLSYVHLISANLYGPGDRFDDNGHVIPGLIKRIDTAHLNNEAFVTVWGTGKPTRDMLYVEDAANAYVAAGAYLLEGNDSIECNIGSGVETSIAELVESIKGLCGYQGAIVFDTSKPDGQMRRKVDSSYAFQALGWQAKTPLNRGLEATIQWYRENVA